MDAITSAINEVTFNIPRQLLEMAFGKQYFGSYADNRSLEQRINDEIIQGYVLPKCNEAGGQLVRIPIDAYYNSTNENGSIYIIPMSATNGRLIINALGIEYTVNDGGLGAVSAYDKSLLTELVNSTMQSGGNNDADVRLIGRNTIIIRNDLTRGPMQLRAVIEHNPDLSNLSSASHRKFSALVLSAVKVFIYTRLSLDLGEGNLNGGTVNGYMRSTLDEYAAEREIFEERLTKWKKITIMSDRDTYNRFIEMQLRK